jgi:UDP-N-acetylmuramoyl-tripeptide--D-alanyl-D-alanine ligase
MLQSSEYQVGPYIKWFWRTKDFSKVIYRGSLKKTRAATMLLAFISLGIILEITLGVLLINHWYKGDFSGGWELGVSLMIGYPVIWAHLLVVPIILGRWFIVRPLNWFRLKSAEEVFSKHKGLKIAVAGSYGKTSMKELLLSVLSEGKKVAATPANKNVSTSHAIFAEHLSGDEDILIIEYGEGAPGDVRKFAEITHPSRAVITGLAPAHLDKYKTIYAAGKDIFSVASFVGAKNVYVNADSQQTAEFIKSGFNTYSVNGALGWKIVDVEIKVNSTTFTIKKAKKSLTLFSGLIGRHHLGSLTFAAGLALQLGLSEEQVIRGIAKTVPFEHRMQAYSLNGGWVIDDTYNGNLEGIKAGTGLLKELKAKRKIYVTPGLVDQGKDYQIIHREVGQLIASANPDLVVLMRNSVCDYVVEGLKAAGYKNDLIIETNSLAFYQNLKEFLASGDLVVLQNDWPDQYY